MKPNKISIKKNLIFIILLLILIPLILLFMKYKNQEIFKSNEIYKKELVANSIELEYDIKKLLISNSKKWLLAYGYEGGGFSVFSIENIPNLSVLFHIYIFEDKKSELDAVFSKNDEFLYTVSYDFGLRKFNLLSKKQVKKLDLKECYRIDLSKDDKFAFLKCKENLTIVDLEKFKKIKEIPIYKSKFGDIIVNGDLLYLSDYSKNYIYDIKEIQNIKQIAKFETKGFAYDMKIYKNYLILSQRSTIDIYDISNKFKIKYLASYISDEVINGFDMNENMMILSTNKTSSSQSSQLLFLKFKNKNEIELINKISFVDANLIDAIFSLDGKNIYLLADRLVGHYEINKRSKLQIR
ncbi:hypothetical protein [Campylobacter ureolyticus]|uniref:hypothetical protein n=1 Tax=Campylobacter ureolyticus TaxID=827 RepID=UPI0022B46E98|nr:hypothetical protein [Campylobacter ureolyticus]MCZ6169511.1 hypothetical protein [Campylobacter ureolyticus]